MDHDETLRTRWESLAQAVNSQPEDTRRYLLTELRVFLHDLRQTQGQVKSAADLLLHMLSAPPDPEGLAELLDVIRQANHRGEELLAEFTRDFVERINVPD